MKILRLLFFYVCKVLVVALTLVMVFSFTAASFAATGGGDVTQPQSTSGVDFIIDRTSGTSADAEVVVTFSSEADEYSVVVYLQKQVDGVWKNDLNNPDYVFFNNGLNSRAVIFSHTYDSLTRGTTYRLKCICRDIHGTSEYRSTVYSSSF